jgi:hypothetical protein
MGMRKNFKPGPVFGQGRKLQGWLFLLGAVSYETQARQDFGNELA